MMVCYQTALPTKIPTSKSNITHITYVVQTAYISDELLPLGMYIFFKKKANQTKITSNFVTTDTGRDSEKNIRF